MVIKKDSMSRVGVAELSMFCILEVRKVLADLLEL